MVAGVSNPSDLAPIENPYLLWSAAIKPNGRMLTSLKTPPILEKIRAIKSPAEVALLKGRACLPLRVPGRDGSDRAGTHQPSN
jgi:hypothetical protein